MKVLERVHEAKRVGQAMPRGVTCEKSFGPLGLGVRGVA